MCSGRVAQYGGQAYAATTYKTSTAGLTHLEARVAAHELGMGGVHGSNEGSQHVMAV